MLQVLRRRLTANGVWYILPTIIVLFLIIIYPLIYQLYFSFFRTSFFSESLKFVGLENYSDVMMSPDFWNSFIRSVLWTVACVVLQMVLGFSAALVFNEKFKGCGIFRALVLIPWILPAVVAASTWRWMYHADFGVVNSILRQLGLISSNVNWLGNLNLGIWAVVFVNVWKMYPFVMLMILAALQAIPRELYEAASIDGANAFQAFRYVTLPATKAIRVVTNLLLIIWSLNAFTIIFVLTEGGPLKTTEIVSLYIYRLIFQNYQFGEAAAVAMVLFLVMVFFTAIYVKQLYAKEDAR